MQLPRRAYAAGAAAWAVAGLFFGYWFLRFRWQPGVDFDPTGFFWVLQNLPRLFALGLAAGFLGGAVYCGVRVAMDS